MKSKLLLSCLVLLTGLLASTACSYVSQEEYDGLATNLAHVQEELADAKDLVYQLQTSLVKAQADLQGANAELDYYQSNPPIMEVDFFDTARIAKLTGLKAYKEVAADSTYILRCEIELAGDLPELFNVVDVEFYIDDTFKSSGRWIDISSSGFITTRHVIHFDTYLTELNKPIQIKIVPSFKVFGV